MNGEGNGRLGRRDFLTWASRRGAAAGLIASSMPALLAACAREEPEVTPGPGAQPSPTGEGEKARAIVGDALEFDLEPQGWPGPFGFVTFRLRRGSVGGKDVFYVQTDASDQAFATEHKLVFTPKIAGLAKEGLSAGAYLVSGGTPDQPTVFSTEPGRDDYTPAWRVHRVTWRATPRRLSSVAEVEDAASRGEVTVERTNVVLNAGMVKWSTGEMAVDGEKTGYLGQGQLLEPPNTSSMTVKLKLHECFPGVRYIVLDHSMKAAAEMTRTVFSPRLDEGPKAADATGRTNVFLNGLKGPGPMGFQPSVFDSQAGSTEWSPYWDHFMYEWKQGRAPRVLRTEKEVHTARDAGELTEYPGTPDTNGRVFTVNCPVPVLAPNAFTG